MIHHAEHTEQFLSISNELARTTGLSDGAFRLLVFMLSMSDDWTFSVSGIAYTLGWPERTVQRLVAELKKAGYVVQRLQFDDNGKFIPSAWDVYEEPVDGIRVSRKASTTQSVNDAKREPRKASPTQDVKSAPFRKPIYKEQSNIKERTMVKKEGARVFKKPTVEEVAAYCQERNNGVNAQAFIDHYESNGWKVGRNPMKDWKATVRTWERYDYDRPKKAEPIIENPFTKLLKEEGYT